MRSWEVDDVKAMPGDMVREQDFIMRLRHMHRQGSPYLIFNIAFAGLPDLEADLAQREDMRRGLAEAVAALGGTMHFMADGDAFAVIPGPPRADAAGKIAASLALPGIAADKLVTAYELPRDYPSLRERGNHYIEVARAAAQIGAGHAQAEHALQSDSVRGPLTVWALSQIEKLLEDIDVRRYVRHQAIYRRTETSWQAAGAEYFVAVDELRKDRFARLDIRRPERLFMELCAALDHRLLQQFADQPETLATGPLNLNIAVETVLGAPFARFCKSVPAVRRREITFEINRGDLLLNFATTRTALELLRQEGFGVAIDALHPEILPFLNCALLPADFYKIRVSEDLIAPLGTPEVLLALQALPREKLVFYRCDNDIALDIGARLGVRLYQGWLIDDRAETGVGG